MFRVAERISKKKNINKKPGLVKPAFKTNQPEIWMIIVIQSQK